jgi:hypothetical protein
MDNCKEGMRNYSLQDIDIVQQQQPEIILKNDITTRIFIGGISIITIYIAYKLLYKNIK